MPARLSFLSALALTTAVACAPPAEAPMMAGATAADTAAIMAIRDAEIAGLAAKDTVMSYLAEDVHLLPEGEPSVHGIAAARAWFAGFGAMFNATVSYSNQTLVFSGDMAVETYDALLTMTPVAGGDPMVSPSKGIHVYRKDASGNWKLAIDMWNSNAPMPAAPTP